MQKGIIFIQLPHTIFVPEIRVLPPNIVEKIAAGEVVERPASVVKELVENSIDAGATKIAIYVDGGGTKRIRVVDDGCGMSEEDAILALKRHATSKIKSEEDLNRISTLGFRGEALPSIAAVSKLTIITKRKEDLVGTKIHVEGGEIKNITSIGAPPGTSVLVEELFYNAPARRKFLKSERSEFFQIYSIVEKYAIIYENIHFKLVHNGKEIFNLPPSNLKARIARLWGKEIADAMVEIKKSNRMKIKGLIAKPYQVRRDKNKLLIFVNGRYVKSRIIEDALVEGYGTLLFRDSYPIAILKIQVEPDEIDVNVHPAKLFVKFKDENRIKKEIANLIWSSLTKEENIPSKIIAREERAEKIKIEREKQMVFDVEEPSKMRRIEDFIPIMRTIPMEILGQVDDTYIILKSSEGLVIVDQHAAHERIRYERFLRDMKDKNIQKLLEPIILNLDYKEYQFILEQKESLRDYGFIIEDFGTNSIVVRGIPPILTKRDAEDAIREIAQLGPKSIEEKRDELIKLISCKGAIKAHQKLSQFEMEKLIMDLLRCENPYTCPHGRPTMIKIKNEDLEKMFKRKE
ncbi:DNA mismatch repair protein MutL [Aciduliprofundum boonei T469]|nr:DNA mismatch repair protein MutL [Aciduliprofundum boonei T469]